MFISRRDREFIEAWLRSIDNRLNKVERDHLHIRAGEGPESALTSLLNTEQWDGMRALNGQRDDMAAVEAVAKLLWRAVVDAEPIYHGYTREWCNEGKYQQEGYRRAARLLLARERGLRGDRIGANNDALERALAGEHDFPGARARKKADEAAPAFHTRDREEPT